MKVLFAHDHRFIESAGQVWSESQFDAAMWSRYLAHVQRLTVAGRRGAISSGKKLDELELSSAPDVTFELFPNLSSIRGITVNRAAAARRMRALVTEHDGVIARLPSEIGLLAIEIARELGLPWAVEVVGCPWDGLRHYGSTAGRLYAPIAYMRMRRAVGDAQHAIYVTREFLQRRYPSNATNQANASDVMINDVVPDVLHARLARISAMNDQPIRFGLIGTLRGRFKGIQTLLSALAQTRGKLPALQVHILGGGDAAPWMREAEAKGVGDLLTFDGTRPAGLPVLQWLDEIDIYLQPSLKEGLPRATIEAMSRGCPVLASTVAGIPEILPNEDLIDPGDARQLARLLELRVADRAWMATRARSNWQTACEYSAEVLDDRRSVFWGRFRRCANEAKLQRQAASSRN